MVPVKKSGQVAKTCVNVLLIFGRTSSFVKKILLGSNKYAGDLLSTNLIIHCRIFSTSNFEITNRNVIYHFCQMLSIFQRKDRVVEALQVQV